MAGPPSIISSRMTDIASDDGAERESQQQPPQGAAGALRRSQLASDTLSRPGTARTGMSSSRTQTQPLRRALSGKRTSVAGSTFSSSTSGRPGSVSRSHVPSLTSHAFFRPMSSQKLQAQRSVGRPSTIGDRYSATDDELHENPSHNAAAVVTHWSAPTSGPGSQLLARLAHRTTDDVELQPPPSRGTELTEHETLDRITANTSPTYGHYPTGSLSESVRPLQNSAVAAHGRDKGLSVRTDNRNYRSTGKSAIQGGGGAAMPLKSPRSFRSSFLLPTKGGDSAHTGANRDIQGGEKLDSVASSPQLSPAVPVTAVGHSEGPAATTMARVGRNFEHFEGNTVFCISGRLQNTRSQPVNIATGACIVVPCVLFFIFSAPWLWHNIHPSIPVSFGYLFYVCLSSFLHASSSDPGILPRNLHRFPPPDQNEDPLRLGPPTTDWTLIRSTETSAAAMEVPTKYCKTCNIWRPPRAHHCRLCDNCIETADHHCVWLNNCIGRRNYRYFFAFVSSASLLSCYLVGASLAQILVYMGRERVSFGDAIDHFRVPFAMAIYGVFAFLYPAALMAYHLFLMARGETTREFLNSHKFLKKDRYRAFTHGSWVRNWIVVLCRPRPPTYYRFKAKLVPGDQRLASRRRNEIAARSESRDDMEMQDVGLPPAEPKAGGASTRASGPAA